MKHFLTKQRRSQQSYLYAFTIVELLIVIAIISILAGITAIGVSTWRTSVAETEVKNDLANVQAGMEDYQNRHNGYPTTISEGSEFSAGNAETKDIFVQSEDVTITYVRGDDKVYCVDVRSKQVPGVYMFLDTAGGNKTPQTGTCDGGIGATPPQPNQTVFVFDTTAPGCTGTVQLPVSSPTTGGTVDWGDGSVQTRNASLMAHTYAIPGRYVVTYEGPMTAASYASYLGSPNVSYVNASCLTRVNQWGSSALPVKVSFVLAANLAYVAEPPNSVTDMSSLFDKATKFNQPIGHWDVSNVTNMQYMFFGAHSFNQPIGDWDVSSVTNMEQMFFGGVALVDDLMMFNQPIGDWDVSSVTTMRRMFARASWFNQPIGNWDVSNVTDMSGMFESNGPYARSRFNQPIGNWNVSNVTNMSTMFNSSRDFNQNISSWDVGAVTTWSNFHTNSPLVQANCPAKLW